MSRPGFFFHKAVDLMIWVRQMHLEIQDLIVQNTFNGFIINASIKVCNMTYLWDENRLTYFVK